MEKAEPVVAEEENKGNSMYDLEVDCARRKQAELLEMFPSQKQRILSAMNNIGKITGVKPQKIKKLLDSDKLLEKYCTRASNITFDEQRNLVKKLVESADGEQSDYESEPEGELTEIESDVEDLGKSRQEKKLEKKQSRIFKHLIFPLL